MPDPPIPQFRPSAPETGPQTSLWDLGLLFLRLGSTSLGGPAAHIAMMQNEFVDRRGWLTAEEFLDYLGAANLIPGPNSTELAIHIGYARCGWQGLLVAGAAFILPAALIVGVIAAAYVKWRYLPQVAQVFYGVKPVVIAVVAQALIALARKAARTAPLILAGAAATVLSLFSWNELAILFGSGALFALIEAIRRRKPIRLDTFLLFIPTGATAPEPFGLWALFFFFLKVGSVLFGSGYVLLAFLRDDLVDRWHWLTNAQLLDALSIGQMTPGPVFTTATFIGYVLAGVPGAVAATVGIFLPAFIFVAISGVILPRLRNSAIAGGFLDGVNVASLGLMAAVTWQLAVSALIDLPTGLLAAGSFVCLFRTRLNPVWLMAAGALVGLTGSR